jgi:hypothetical protein
MIALALVLLAAAPRAELSFSSSTEACSRSALEEAVATRLGYPPFAEGEPLKVSIEILGHAALSARVRVTRTGAPAGERTFAGAPDCDQLTQALALALAVAIDPLALSRRSPAAAPPGPATPLSPPPAPVAPAPAAQVSTPVSAASAERDDHLGLRVQAGLWLGLQPAGWLAASTGARYAFRQVAFEVDGFMVIPSGAELAPGVQVSSLSAGASVAGCYAWKGLEGCASLSAGALRFEAQGLARAQTGWSGFAAVGPRVGVRLPFSAPAVAALRVQADLSIPLLRIAMHVSQDTVWQQSPVTFGLLLGGELKVF